MNARLAARPTSAAPAPAARSPRRLARSLHSQIGLLWVAMFAALFTLATALLGDTMRRETLALSGRTIEEVGRQMARELSQRMTERCRNVTMMAADAALVDPRLDPTAKRALLERFARTYPEFTWVGLADAADGRVRAATDGVFEQGSVVGRPVFDQARETLYVGDVHEAVRLAHLLAPNPDGSPLRFVDIGAPVRNAEGRTQAVLATHLSWAWAGIAREAVLRAVHQQLGVELFVVNSEGDVLLTASGDVPLGKPLAGLIDASPEAQWAVRRWADGRRYLTVAVPSGIDTGTSRLDWTVVARQPVETATAPLLRVAGDFYLGAAAIGLAALLSGWWLIGRMVRPMREIAGAALQAAESGRLPVLPAVQGSSEAAVLLRAVHRFVDATAAREAALREADTRKDEFLAMLAHELRNPLAPLTNALRLLERGVPAQAAQAAVGMAQRQTRQLTRLVDDLLEVSRITQGKIGLRRRPVAVADVVRDAAGSVATMLAVRGQTLALDLPEDGTLRLDADPARLLQVLENLLTNASKYSDDGGAITLRVCAEADMVRIEVSDAGVGIAPEALPQLFQLFSQVDATIDRSQGGLGIGLALVRRLVELHGGAVSAHSAGKGQGATFVVRLPRLREAPAA